MADGASFFSGGGGGTTEIIGWRCRFHDIGMQILALECDRAAGDVEVGLACESTLDVLQYRGKFRYMADEFFRAPVGRCAEEKTQPDRIDGIIEDERRSSFPLPEIEQRLGEARLLCRPQHFVALFQGIETQLGTLRKDGLAQRVESPEPPVGLECRVPGAVGARTH